MKKSAKILIVASVLIVLTVVLIVVLRRRGKKVYIKEPYRRNSNYTIYLVDRNGQIAYHFDGALDYVIVPTKEDPMDFSDDNSNLYKFSPVTEVGYILPGGKTKRQRLNGTFYIDPRWLEY